MNAPLTRFCACIGIMLGTLGMMALTAQPTAAAPSAQKPAASTAVLEVSIDTLASTDNADALALAVNDLVRSSVGCAMSSTARTDDAKLVRATIWNSTADAEAAALALDDHERIQTLAKATDAAKRSLSHFRQIRSSTYSADAAGHLEVVIFRTKPGTTREANIAIFDKAEAEFATGDGLLGHSLWLAPDGRWVHLLHWRSAEDYTKTGKALFGKPGVGGWIRSLDFKRFAVTRGDILKAKP